MAVLWHPGQDVDFLARLEKVEKLLERLLSDRARSAMLAVTPTDDSGDSDLRVRLDDLEEIVLNLGEEIASLEERLDVNVS